MLVWCMVTFFWLYFAAMLNVHVVGQYMHAFLLIGFNCADVYGTAVCMSTTVQTSKYHKRCDFMTTVPVPCG